MPAIQGLLGWGKSLVGVAIAAAAMSAAILLQHSQLQRTTLWQTDPNQAEQQEAIRLQLLKYTPTFGFDNLLADWVFLNYLQYYGDTPARQQTGYSLSLNYFDILTRLDPRFVDIYLFLSGSISYQLGKPEIAIDLMKRGTEVLSPQISPRAFTVWRFMGIDQFLLLGDGTASAHSHDMAAKWVEGTEYQNFSPLFRQTAAFLRSDPNSIPVRFQMWTTVYAQAEAVGDKQTQERAKSEILKLGGQVRQNNGKVEFLPPKL